jgi:hypothetical protein
VRHEVAGHVHGVDQELPVVDADMHVRPEDEQLLRQVLHVRLHPHVALQRGDLLRGPVGEGVRPGRGHPQVLAGRQPDHHPPQALQLGARLRRRLAHARPDLHDALVQLGLDLAQHQVVVVQDLGDVGAQLPRLRVDDLVLFLDPDGERRRLHGSSPGTRVNGSTQYEVR